MLSIRYLLVAMLFISLIFSANQAQEKPTDSTGEIAKIEKTYDSAKDQTTIRFSGWPIAELQDEKIFMDAEGSYPGHTPRQPARDIDLKITVVSSSGYKYSKPVNLTVTLGTYRFQPWHLAILSRTMTNGEYVQELAATVDFNEFFTIAQTTNVQMELNQTQFLLQAPRLKKLRELGRLMVGI